MGLYYYSSLIVRISIGGLFIAAGLLKLRDINEFAWSIFQYGIVPQGLVPIAAVGLPITEVLAGTAFLFRLRGSHFVLMGLLGLFIAVLTYGLATGLVMECGCFPGEELAGGSSLKAALIRDLVIATGVLFVYFSSFRKSKWT